MTNHQCEPDNGVRVDVPVDASILLRPSFMRKVPYSDDRTIHENRSQMNPNTRMPCFNPTALMPALLEQAPKFVYQAPLSVKLDSNGEQKMLKEHV